MVILEGCGAVVLYNIGRCFVWKTIHVSVFSFLLLIACFKDIFWGGIFKPLIDWTDERERGRGRGIDMQQRAPGRSRTQAAAATALYMGCLLYH